MTLTYFRYGSNDGNQKAVCKQWNDRSFSMKVRLPAYAEVYVAINNWLPLAVYM